MTNSLTASTTALREEKSQLKHQLKAFDSDFKATHGRMVHCVLHSHARYLSHLPWMPCLSTSLPASIISVVCSCCVCQYCVWLCSCCVCLHQPTKADKEVIRHMYKRYHDVKALLVGMEAASGGHQSSRSASGGGAEPRPSSTSASASASLTLDTPDSGYGFAHIPTWMDRFLQCCAIVQDCPCFCLLLLLWWWWWRRWWWLCFLLSVQHG